MTQCLEKCPECGAGGIALQPPKSPEEMLRMRGKRTGMPSVSDIFLCLSCGWPHK